jgi:hypothetical protein
VSRPSHLFDLTFDLTMCPCRRPASWPPLRAAFIKEVDQHGRSAADPRDLGPATLSDAPAGVCARSAAGIAQMRRLERDELWLDRHPALAFCLSMIFSENRIPLFRIMLSSARVHDLYERLRSLPLGAMELASAFTIGLARTVLLLSAGRKERRSNENASGQASASGMGLSRSTPKLLAQPPYLRYRHNRGRDGRLGRDFITCRSRACSNVPCGGHTGCTDGCAPAPLADAA